ncbi:MAG TPA: Ger(x)C family spore germination protein [Candidatus Deferrimicrobium sp.]|nr:Ger(x)C family spore germination protein [Candidatus Deferrimicrobium sp.]
MELEDQAYVVAIGVDITPDNSEERIVTAQIIIPSKLAGGASGGGEGKSFYQVSVRDKSVFAGLDKMEAVVSRRISLLQCKAILMSEEYASSSIAAMVRVASRHPQLRRNIFIAVVPGSAREFLEKNQPKLTVNITRYWEDISKANKYTGFTSFSNLQTIVEGLESPGENSVITMAAVGESSPEDRPPQSAQAGQLPRAGGTKGEFVGNAVFRGDKMVGKMGDIESKMLSMLRGEWRSGPFSVPAPNDPKNSIGLTLRQETSPKVTVDLESEPIRIDIKLKLSGSLVSEFGSVDYTVGEQRKNLENSAREEIEKQASALIARAQNEFDSDIFRFGNTGVKKKFLTWKEWEDFKWHDKFPQVDIQVTAEVNISQFGFENAPATVKH